MKSLVKPGFTLALLLAAGWTVLTYGIAHSDTNAVAHAVERMPATIKFTHNGVANEGWINGSFSCNKLANINLDNGVVTVRGNRIYIQAVPQYYETPRLLLSGYVLRAEDDSTAKEKEFVGLAYFTEGEYIDRLDNLDNPDLIFKNDGAVQGQISSINEKEVQLRQRFNNTLTLPLEAITFIRSPRAFTFSIIDNEDISSKDKSKLDYLVFKPTNQTLSLPSTSIIGKPAKKKSFFSSDEEDVQEDEEDETPIRFFWKKQQQ
jgi:hypothetical protein